RTMWSDRGPCALCGRICPLRRASSLCGDRDMWPPWTTMRQPSPRPSCPRPEPMRPRTPASSGTGNSLGERIAVTDMDDDDSAPTPDDEGRTPHPDDDGASTPGEEHSGSVPDEEVSASAPDADDRADWHHDVPDPERIETDRSRISDEEWQDLVRQIAEPSAVMGDMPVDEVREALDASDHWQPEP